MTALIKGNKRLILVLLIAIAILSFYSNSLYSKKVEWQISPQENIDGWGISTPEQQGIDSYQIDNLFNFIQKNSEYSNIHSILLVKNGYLITEGYLNKNKQHKIGNIKSVTKSITSILLGIAIDQGYIKSVDDNISIYFPEYFEDEDDPKRLITIRDLLTMETGLNWDEWASSYKDPNGMYKSKDTIAYVLNRELTFDPGKKFTYSTGTSQLLAGVIQRATLMSLEEFSLNYLFKPLGIQDYQWKKSKDGINYGGVHLYLKPRDLAKIGQLSLNKGLWNGNTIVSSEWIDTSTSGHTIFGYDDGPYGYHWWIRPKGYMAQGYGGQYIYVIPKEQLVIIITANPNGRKHLDVPQIENVIEKFIYPHVRY